MQRTMMTIDKEWLGFGDNIRFRIVEDAMLHSIRLLASPHIETVHSVMYSKGRWTTGRPDWYNTRWARFLRWINNKVPLPKPLHVLAKAEWWRYEYEVERWPEELLDRIRIQAALLSSRDIEPVAICCGPMGRDHLVATAYAYMQHRQPSSQIEPGWFLFGLPIRVIPWLKRDEVMVV